MNPKDARICSERSGSIDRGSRNQERVKRCQVLQGSVMNVRLPYLRFDFLSSMSASPCKQIKP